MASDSLSKGGSRKDCPLPVTLLSGFLGAGKTTLLQHILTQDHGLRIAVIVNDIGIVNIDASIIQNHSLTESKENLVSMQNGCICCTLRGDLLEGLLKLHNMQQFDYIIIESSGISEPAQVAETFDVRLADQMQIQNIEGEVDLELQKAIEQVQKAGGLEKFAKLDTTVTVIDSFNMMKQFDTEDLLTDRRKDTPDEDDRTISDLMVDQIEFANVIILNKLDMVDQELKKELVQVIRSLNKDCKIIEAKYGRVDPNEILNTATFDLEVARNTFGWLQDLDRMTKFEHDGRNVIAPKPETEEYDIWNMVYKTRRPFHPRRLMELVHDKFILELGEHDEWEEEEDEDEDMEGKTTDSTKDSEDDPAVVGSQGDDSVTTGSEGKKSDESRTSTPQTELDEDNEDEGGVLITPENDICLENKRNHPVFKDLYRSKGFIWMATRPNSRGHWSQAGGMLTLVGDMEWFCHQKPPYHSDPEIDAQARADVEKGGEWGDREQELVFIGTKLDRVALKALLDECLLNDEEWQTCKGIMRSEKDLETQKQMLMDEFDDGWPAWDDDDEDDHDHEGHDHGHGHSHAVPKASRNISDFTEELKEVD